MNDRERFLNWMNYQPVDRCPWWEMWYWRETLERWHDEGLPEDVNLAEWLGVDRRENIGVSIGLVPAFKEETVEETDEYRVYQDHDGRIRKEFKEKGDTTMPQWLRAPLETRDDWENAIKPRLNPSSPCRYPAYWADKVRCLQGRDYPVCISAGSIFGWLRNWMGFDRICMTLYDDPDWIHEMMDYVAEFIVAVITPALEQVDVDYATMWEDMAYKSGPIISPAMFREFMLEPYKKITSALHNHGVHLIFVDSDGDSGPLIPLWLEGGVTGFYPIERNSGMDPVVLRKAFGRELRLIGGIDKKAMAKGGAAVDAELENIRPLLQEGGYIPWCDHLVPPDVPLSNYMYYVERMKALTLAPS